VEIEPVILVAIIPLWAFTLLAFLGFWEEVEDETRRQRRFPPLPPPPPLSEHEKHERHMARQLALAQEVRQ
jgi:hypothetical protein